jgi:hypothetical protein
VVVTDYRPFTPIHSDNVIGHLLFGLSARHVRHVLTGGRFALRERVIVSCPEAEIRAAAQCEAERMWQRLETIA